MKNNKKPTPQKLKSLVIDAVRRHAWNLGISEYEVDILWMGKEMEDNGENYPTVAEIDVLRRYLKATIKIYPCFVKEWEERGDEFVEKTIAHEVAHIATAHLKDCAYYRHVEQSEIKDAWETLTERLGRLSFKLNEYNIKQQNEKMLH